MAGLLDLLTRRAAPPPRRVEPRLAPAAVEQRFGGWLSDGWGASGISGALPTRSAVASHLAENLSAVLGAVELISSSIASLPASLVCDTPDGRQPAPPTAPGWRLLGRVNARQSTPAFMSWLTASYLLHGNALARIDTDGRGAVMGLTPAPWPWISPVVVASSGGSRLVFDLMQAVPEAALLGLPPRLLDTDCLHVRARSDHGVLGRSVLSRAAGPVHEGLHIAALAAATWERGMRPSGIMTAPQALKPDQRGRARELLEQFQGAQHTGKVPLLEAGWQFVPLTLNSVDMEFLGMRQFSVAEIARMFCIPEPLLQLGQRVPADLAPYTTAFAQLALAPIVAAIEAEFDASVLPAGMHLQLDMGGLMRGSFSGMTAALCAATQSGVLTPNDARRSMGLPAVPGGDELRLGQAPSWPADAAGMPSMGPKPGPTGSGVPAPGTNANEGAG